MFVIVPRVPACRLSKDLLQKHEDRREGLNSHPENGGEGLHRGHRGSLLPQRPGCPALLSWNLKVALLDLICQYFLLFPPPPHSICLQQASFYPDVSEEVRTRALRYGTECTLGYLDLLEHVLVVRRGMGRVGQSCVPLSLPG